MDGGQANSQKLSLEKTSVWGQKVRNSSGKLKISEVCVAGGPGEIADVELRLDISMGCKK